MILGAHFYGPLSLIHNLCVEHCNLHKRHSNWQQMGLLQHGTVLQVIYVFADVSIGGLNNTLYKGIYYYACCAWILVFV